MPRTTTEYTFGGERRHIIYDDASELRSSRSRFWAMNQMNILNPQEILVPTFEIATNPQMRLNSSVDSSSSSSSSSYNDDNFLYLKDFCRDLMKFIRGNGLKNCICGEKAELKSDGITWYVVYHHGNNFSCEHFKRHNTINTWNVNGYKRCRDGYVRAEDEPGL